VLMGERLLTKYPVGDCDGHPARPKSGGVICYRHETLWSGPAGSTFSWSGQGSSITQKDRLVDLATLVRRSSSTDAAARHKTTTAFAIGQQ
jgi:hypothetical protein